MTVQRLYTISTNEMEFIGLIKIYITTNKQVICNHLKTYYHLSRAESMELLTLRKPKLS